MFLHDKIKTIQSFKKIEDKIWQKVCLDCEHIFCPSESNDKCMECATVYYPNSDGLGDICPSCNSDDYDNICPSCNSTNNIYADSYDINFSL